VLLNSRGSLIAYEQFLSESQETLNVGMAPTRNICNT